MPVERNPRQDAFTLIELLVVIAIIGIIISLILVAAADGVRRAEERQTQTLITKLNAALTDRIDALLATSPPINQTHRYLASVTFTDSNSNNYQVPGSELKRAQVIALTDYLKAEMPDVFFINNATYFSNYPLNFAALPYPLSNPNGVHDFALPLGNYAPGMPYLLAYNAASIDYTPTPGFNPASGYNGGTGLVVSADTGIFGASFTAAAGLYKNLYESAAADVIAANPGAVVQARFGYDGADNDQDGMIDDLNEVTVSGGGASQATFQAAVAARLSKHTHKTARSEALYALMVEAQGPLGSAFDRSEFTNRDVADTDGDGLPEFIDAWGEPLQFYRWPIYYGPNTTASSAVGNTSDSQQGYDVYSNFQPRQQDPLDQNQLLMSTGWWATNYLASGSNPGLPTTTGGVPDFVTGYTGSPASAQANAFMTYFHILVDPYALPTTSPVDPLTVQNWDRTGSLRRRAYYSRFLVLSAGPDLIPGTFQLNHDYSLVDGSYATPTPASTTTPPSGFPTGTLLTDVQLLNWVESQAAQVDYGARSGSFLEVVTQTNTSLYLQSTAGVDDISNQTLTAPGAGAK